MDELTLLRAFEPVLRMTKGESFVPVDVTAYVANAALWRSLPEGTSRMEAQPGTLDLPGLAHLGADLPGAGQSLSVVSSGQKVTLRKRLRVRDRRERLRGGSRLAEVGLLGRSIDSVNRLSLLFRGSVPGGSATASLAVQQDCLNPDRPTYFGRVLRDGGYIVCQYWFFYSFNNWRSGFGGVNEHEADWEQVTIYLDGLGPLDADGLPVPRWVVFSAHDETGDDLRRRWDDPDLGLVDGRHPIVHAGAGSHSGAYLAGDYLITVEPPNLGGAVKAVRRVARTLTPWTTSAQGVGIPYIDYARGDGLAIGPGQQVQWSPVVIDETTPWVVDYRGLWGHDTKDRLGGERGPAGPRYERDGTVRASWADPVGWAGLAKVAPNPAVEHEFVAARVREIDAELVEIEGRIDQGRRGLLTRSAGLEPASIEVRNLLGQERDMLGLRMRATFLADERARLDRSSAADLPVADVHAHLSHRRVPIQPTGRARERLLGIWAVISTPLILWMAANIVNPDVQSRALTALTGLVIVLSLEALARGYFLAFILRVAVLVAAGVALYYGYEDWQTVTSWLLAGTALLILLVNVRDSLLR